MSQRRCRCRLCCWLHDWSVADCFRSSPFNSKLRMCAAMIAAHIILSLHLQHIDPAAAEWLIRAAAYICAAAELFGMTLASHGKGCCMCITAGPYGAHGWHLLQHVQQHCQAAVLLDRCVCMFGSRLCSHGLSGVLPAHTTFDGTQHQHLWCDLITMFLLSTFVRRTASIAGWLCQSLPKW